MTGFTDATLEHMRRVSTATLTTQMFKRGPPHASLQQVAHAEFPTHLPHVERSAAVGEAGVARDDEQPAIT